MRNPYIITEQTAISFSGGRTSGYMLYKILEANGGQIPDCAKVVFANTGKELPETLDFIQACSDHWGVEIVWVELESYQHIEVEGKRNRSEKTYKVVDYASAARNGEPFDALLKGLPAIPNAVARSCTAALKIRAQSWYVKDVCGFDSPWTQLIGIRADEQRRAVKLHGKRDEGHEAYLPLWLDGVTKNEVGKFWSNNNFDLQLPNNNGTTDWGNCDLCFLKARTKRLSIIRERPDLVGWWIDAEEKKGQQFRPDEPSYAQMEVIASDQGSLFEYDDESISCFCGD